ncbi:MAG TPA: hypothetical protein VEU96_00640 [Bryobacteraceae bacterium]|nr:hypothetical protein [Bryobacteraceae bacterium]
MRTLPAILALSFPSLWAQATSTVSLGNGVQLRIASNSDKGNPGHLTTEMKPAARNSVYRIHRDESGLAVYAYELVVDPLPDGEHFQIVAKPADEVFAAKFPYADGGKPTPTLQHQIESVPLTTGGRMTIEIPTNPGWFEHRTDTVFIGFIAKVAQAAPQFRFVALKVAIDGKQPPMYSTGTTVSGRYAMFYIPGRGGYFFSTEPVENHPFVPAATVDGVTLKFTIDNEEFVCSSDAPILMRSDRGKIWVYHDRGYRLTGNLTRQNRRGPTTFFTAASDSLEYWLP